jgi:hypothetical protein
MWSRVTRAICSIGYDSNASGKCSNAAGRLAVGIGIGKSGMKCFYHHDQDAVGECKSCGKGLCPACAVDLGKGLACRQRCEDNVRG